ncbi:MAG: hypothetical protein JSR26_12305 [Proteobacteria bacterium]|nr:hypothetical protein [Pseudomonadota bacterium]
MLRTTRRLACLLLAAAVAAPPAPAATAADDRHATATDTQTVVFVRHGEKPADGLGQLSCQGLNRALALPKAIATQFGKPDAVFAPDPGMAKLDHHHSYDYVRPLATIEPTAIRFGLPVQAHIGYSDTAALVAELDQPIYRKALLLVAWEHVELVQAARALMAANGGDARQVPDWDYDDFDGIYVVRITRGPEGAHASFQRQREHLDGQPTQCPNAP